MNSNYFVFLMALFTYNNKTKYLSHYFESILQHIKCDELLISKDYLLTKGFKSNIIFLRVSNDNELYCTLNSENYKTENFIKTFQISFVDIV